MQPTPANVSRILRAAASRNEAAARRDRMGKPIRLNEGSTLSIRTRVARISATSSAAVANVQPDNRLTTVDNAFFMAQRAIDQKQVMQVVWVYEHAFDFDGLKRFNHNLGHGLLGRRIERSPLPFARHRWVAYRGTGAIDIAERERPRSDLSDWADERSQLPTDPESESGWHLGVLRLEDGSTAVSLVASHSLLDGLGLMAALAEAVLGNVRDLGLPPPRWRTRLRAAAQDARQTIQDLPQAGRALVAVANLAREHRGDFLAAAKNARRQRREMAGSPTAQPVAPSGVDSDEVVIVPAISIHVDLNDWNARAESLGATSNTLVAGLAVKFGDRLGRRRASDGAVTLQLPISDRTEGDTRANAMSYARVTFDPDQVTTDLRGLRVAIKEALSTMRETPNEPSHDAIPPATLGIIWLTQFAPKRALTRLSDVRISDPDLPVFCSNIGDLGLVVGRLDGTDSDYATGRAVGQNVTRQFLEQSGGLLSLQCWRIGAKVGITVVAFQPGGDNTKAALRDLAAHTLAEFALTGEIE